MIFSSLFRPRNSIVLTFDKFRPGETEPFFEQLDEIKKYYKFSTLSELAAKPKAGHAAVLFENPRKGAFLTVIPVLIADRIPFTLCLRTDCIGTNRLPVGEMLEVYRKTYPEKTTLLGQMQSATADELRAKLGPFPVEKSDPLDYFVTWGKIKELPPSSFEVGLNISDFTDDKLITEELNFIERQLQRRPRVGLTSAEGKMPKIPDVAAVVTAREGVIDARTSPYDLPRYILKKND